MDHHLCYCIYGISTRYDFILNFDTSGFVYLFINFSVYDIIISFSVCKNNIRCVFIYFEQLIIAYKNEFLSFFNILLVPRSVKFRVEECLTIKFSRLAIIGFLTLSLFNTLRVNLDFLLDFFSKTDHRISKGKKSEHYFQ